MSSAHPRATTIESYTYLPAPAGFNIWNVTIDHERSHIDRHQILVFALPSPQIRISSDDISEEGVAMNYECVETSLLPEIRFCYMKFYTATFMGEESQWIEHGEFVFFTFDDAKAFLASEIERRGFELPITLMTPSQKTAALKAVTSLGIRA